MMVSLCHWGAKKSIRDYLVRWCLGKVGGCQYTLCQTVGGVQTVLEFSNSIQAHLHGNVHLHGNEVNARVVTS